MTIDFKAVSSDPFPRRVNRDLRYFVKMREEATTEREECFAERDGLLAELADLDEGSEDAAEIEVKHSRVVRRIERLAKTIAWCNQQIGQLVKKADDQDLFIESVDVPPPGPPEDLFTHKRKAKAEEPPADERPVGEPDVPGQQQIGDEEEQPATLGARNTARMKAEEKTGAEGGIRIRWSELNLPGRFRVDDGRGKSVDFIAGDEEAFHSQLCEFIGPEYAARYQGVGHEGYVLLSGAPLAVAIRLRRLGEAKPDAPAKPAGKPAKKSKAK